MLVMLAQQAAEASTDDQILARLLHQDTFELVIIFGTGTAIAIVAILAGVVRSILATRAKERTRQEVAAYVAEGSMTAAEGERLLRAGDGKRDDG